MLRPTAFKPIVPKSRASMQYLSPRHSAGAPESQNNLNLLTPAHRELSPCVSDKSALYSRSRNSVGGMQLSDGERSSLSSLPPYSSAVYSQALGEVPAGPLEPMKCGAPVSGHSNSDSGRSSSKSTGSGSISGRAQPLSDSGSGGRSPGPVEGYEGVVRDLEDKLRERDLELQTLRDNLDENEAAICQVGPEGCRSSAGMLLEFGGEGGAPLSFLQVYEEKQKRFELELEELRQSCATRMQAASQKAQRAQQVLQLQVRTSAPRCRLQPSNALNFHLYGCRFISFSRTRRSYRRSLRSS